jgi:hypothetical protein
MGVTSRVATSTDPASCCLGSTTRAPRIHPSTLLKRHPPALTFEVPENNPLCVKFQLVKAKKESTDTKRPTKDSHFPSAVDSARLLKPGALAATDYLQPAQSLTWSPSCLIPSVALSGATTGPSSTSFPTLATMSSRAS